MMRKAAHTAQRPVFPQYVLWCQFLGLPLWHGVPEGGNFVFSKRNYKYKIKHISFGKYLQTYVWSDKINLKNLIV